MANILRPSRKRNLPTGHCARTSSLQWNDISRSNLVEVKSLFEKKQYKQCIAQCRIILDNYEPSKNQALRLVYVHFYHGLCKEALSAPIHTFNKQKILLLDESLSSYSAAVKSLRDAQDPLLCITTQQPLQKPSYENHAVSVHPKPVLPQTWSYENSVKEYLRDKEPEIVTEPPSLSNSLTSSPEFPATVTTSEDSSITTVSLIYSTTDSESEYSNESLINDPTIFLSQPRSHHYEDAKPESAPKPAFYETRCTPSTTEIPSSFPSGLGIQFPSQLYAEMQTPTPPIVTTTPSSPQPSFQTQQHLFSPLLSTSTTATPTQQTHQWAATTSSFLLSRSLARYSLKHAKLSTQLQKHIDWATATIAKISVQAEKRQLPFVDGGERSAKIRKGAGGSEPVGGEGEEAGGVVGGREEISERRMIDLERRKVRLRECGFKREGRFDAERYEKLANAVLAEL